MLEPIPHEPAVLHLRSELIADGYTDRDIKAALRTGRWIRLRAGTYVRRDAWELLDAAARHLLLADAAVRKTSGAVALSHHTALIACGLEPDGVDLGTVQLLRLDDGASRTEAGIAHHRAVRPDMVPTVRVDGRSIVASGYAVRQVACGLDRKRTLGLLDAAYHARLTDALDQARWDVDALHWPGAAKFRLVLPYADARIESVAESYVRWICLRFHLPMPEPQVDVVDVNGLAGRADFSWLDGRLLGEFDGKVKFTRYLRQGEQPEDVAMRQLGREARLLDTGSAVIRFQWDDVLDRNEERTARRIEARLRQAADLPRPPWAR